MLNLYGLTGVPLKFTVLVDDKKQHFCDTLHDAATCKIITTAVLAVDKGTILLLADVTFKNHTQYHLVAQMKCKYSFTHSISSSYLTVKGFFPPFSVPNL